MEERLSGGLFAPDVRADPYPYYQHLRGHAPVSRIGPIPFWAISRYDDVQAVLGRPELFSSTVMLRADHALLGADPPGHSRVRKIFSRALAESVSRVQDRIPIFATALVERLAKKNDCDLVEELAVPLPALVIAELLGVDPALSVSFRQWSGAVLAESLGQPAKDVREHRRNIEMFDGFLAALVAEKIERPGSDVLSRLRADGREDLLSTAQMLSLARLLVIAGIETTTNLIGNAIHVLLSWPGLLEQVLSDSTSTRDLTEEVLRYDPSVQFVLRRATMQTTIAQVDISAGETVMALIASANRDERRFSEPELFNPTRVREGHLAFGYGPHFCPGALLARCETTAALDALIARISPALRTGRLQTVEWLAFPQLRGPEHLWLTLH
jgi:cytochrome P450